MTGYTLDDYMEFVDEHEDCYHDGNGMRYVLDPDRIKKFMESTSQFIGLRHKGPYNNMVIDLIEDDNGRLLAYERLIPSNKGAAVIVCMYDRKYLLLEQNRHIVGCTQLSFPRGFGEETLDSDENARAEIRQEVGAVVCEMDRIGSIFPDNGLTSNKIDVFEAILDSIDVQIGHEGILGYRLVSREEIERLIADNTINDGITLAAYTIHRSKR